MDTRAYLDFFPEAGKLTVPTFVHVLGSEHIEEPGTWLLNVLAAEDDAVLVEMTGRPLPEGTNFSVAQQIGF
ncbi:hypothetical protein [Escherichia coli]|uniref:hypothetical protein n=1 Tax=Escherichia coli TaxID=562 RepID=UPI001A7E9BF4|nr:hypothetical protein [Escherichia coli]